MKKAIHPPAVELPTTLTRGRGLLPRAAVQPMETEPVPPSVHETLHHPGQPLDPTARAALEPRFGQDFSQVRVHTDAQAAQSAHSVGALAYTAGRNIVFGSGQYRPRQAEGRKLLSHELAHVVQQGGQPSTSPLRISHLHDPAEREAGRIAEQAAPQGSLPRESASASVLYREPDASTNKPDASTAPPAPVAAQTAPQASAQPAPQAAQADPSPGLGPAVEKNVETLLQQQKYQEAINAIVSKKIKDGEIDKNIASNMKMVYDPSYKDNDATSGMPGWDYLENKAEFTKVRIGPSAVTSVQYLYSVIMHEYQHVLYRQTEPNFRESRDDANQGYQRRDEVLAGTWEIMHAQETGLDKTPDEIASRWKILNDAYWHSSPKAQKAQKAAVEGAYKKAQSIVKGSKASLVPFASPSSVNP